MEKYLIKTRSINGGTQKLYKFENGFGASVVKHGYSYEHEKDLWELAVIHYSDKENNDSWKLTYNTAITNDVIGYLTNSKVDEFLIKIKQIKESE